MWWMKHEIIYSKAILNKKNTIVSITVPRCSFKKWLKEKKIQLWVHETMCYSMHSIETHMLTRINNYLYSMWGFNQNCCTELHHNPLSCDKNTGTASGYIIVFSAYMGNDCTGVSLAVHYTPCSDMLAFVFFVMCKITLASRYRYWGCCVYLWELVLAFQIL